MGEKQKERTKGKAGEIVKIEGKEDMMMKIDRIVGIITTERQERAQGTRATTNVAKSLEDAFDKENQDAEASVAEDLKER